MVGISAMKLNKKGFTLIELVITMRIVVIVFGVLANLVGFSTAFFRDENTQVANQTALRQVAVTFEKDVRRYALNSTQITVSVTCYTLGTTTTVTYCHDVANQTISRNGVIVARGIQTLSVDTSITSFVKLRLVTIPDSRNQVSDIEYIVYYRTERS
jgi:Tfp pilus assembly protein PilE